MASPKWYVVSVTGVTGGGKSQLVTYLYRNLPKTCRLIRQDDYFYDEDSPHHIKCPGDVKHFNWDVITCIDMDKMYEDISGIVSQPPVSRRPPISFTNMNQEDKFDKFNLIDGANLTFVRPILLLDGFCLLDDPRIMSLTDKVIFLTLDKKTCWERRLKREFDPPDVPGYFDACVWPMYEEYLKRCKENYQKKTSITFIDGATDIKAINYRPLLEEIAAATCKD